MPVTKTPAIIKAKDGVEIRGLCLPGVVQDGTTDPYQVDSEVVVLVDTTSLTFTVDLSNVEVDGRIVMIYDVGGNCFANNVTITSAATITGKQKLNQDYGVIGYIYRESTGRWYSIINETTKTGYIGPGDFTGSPLSATVTFDTTYVSTNYSIAITGEDARSWSISSKAAGGFTVDSNSSTALTGNVYWTTIAYTS